MTWWFVEISLRSAEDEARRVVAALRSERNIFYFFFFEKPVQVLTKWGQKINSCAKIHPKVLAKKFSTLNKSKEIHPAEVSDLVVQMKQGRDNNIQIGFFA